MKKSICLCLAIMLLVGIFGGCGQTPTAPVESAAAEQPVSSQQTSQPPAESEAAEPPADSTEEASVEESEESVEPFILPIVEEPTTLTYWMRAQPFMGMVQIPDLEMTYWKEMEARTGVSIDLTSAMYFTANENFQLMIASGDWPDIIECITDYFIGGGDAAIEQEIILPMDDLLDEEMPNYQHVLESNTMFNYAVRTRNTNEVYTAGFLTDGNTHNVGKVIRQDWLDEVGLSVPETYDELYEVLKAFQNNGHESPLWTESTMTDCWEYGYNVSLWDTQTQDRAVNVIDGVVKYAPTSDEALEYITMMNKWYSEDLIWKDFMSGTSNVDMSLVKNNTVGIWAVSGGADSLETYAEHSEDPDFSLSPMPVTKLNKDDIVHVMLAPSYMSGGASISSTSEKVDIAAKWIDYNYTEDGYLLNNYGIEGEGLAFEEDGTPHISELYVNNPDYVTVQCMVLYSRYGGPAVSDLNHEHYFYTDEEKAAQAMWKKDFDDAYCYPTVNVLTYEESEELIAIYADISTLVNQTIVSFIVGSKPLSQWDSFIQQIEKMNIARYVEILQTAYDRYIADLAALEA